MNINLNCIYCTIKKSDSLYTEFGENQKKKLPFMKEVFKVISECKEDATAPLVSAQIMRMLNKELGRSDLYKEIKSDSNKLIMDLEDEIMSKINKSNNRVLLGLKYAMTGNYIDFGAMDNVDTDKLHELINEANNIEINMKEYDAFINEMKSAKRLCYIVDNAGEVVFDKIFIKVLKEEFKNTAIDVIVRGKPIYNDATMSDAKEIGLLEVTNVIENGTDIPGTQLDAINSQTLESIENSELIISKGQGNFETLFGNKKNIYYAFLCKCDHFTERFNMKRFSGVFINEANIDIEK